MSELPVTRPFGRSDGVRYIRVMGKNGLVPLFFTLMFAATCLGQRPIVSSEKAQFTDIVSSGIPESPAA